MALPACAKSDEERVRDAILGNLVMQGYPLPLEDERCADPRRTPPAGSCAR